MGLDLVSILAGLAVLVAGGEALVRGASRLALLARVSPAVVGLTVVAAGTSAPEGVVSLLSTLRGSGGIAVGNVVGSNVFNATAILGLAAMVRPLVIRGETVRLEWPVMLLAALALHVLALDGELGRADGALLLAGELAFTGWIVRLDRRGRTRVEAREAALELGPAVTARSTPRAWLAGSGAVAVGVALLAWGSTLLVDGAVGLAGALGVPEVVVGLTVVAAGTSLPELVTSLVAARRGHDDIAVANVVGSNVLNVLGIAGGVALLHPIEVPARVIREDDWWMIGVSLLLFPLIRSGLRVERWEGALLSAVFVGYLARLVATA